MNRRHVIGVVAFVMVFVVVGVLHSQTEGASPSSTAPRTPWGEPALHGIWNSMVTGPRLERPAQYADREFLTDEQVHAVEAEHQRRAHGTGRDVRALRGTPHDVEGAYENILSTRSERWVRSRQTSLIIDPANGRLPLLTAQGQQLWAAGREARLGAAGENGAIPPPPLLVTNAQPTSLGMSPALVAADCPTSPHEWGVWRRQLSRDLVRAMREIFSRDTRSVESVKPVVDEWKRCDSEVSRTTLTVQTCLEDLSTYMNALWLRTEKKYLGGYRISDASYYEKADSITVIPAELQTPALLEDVTRFGRLSRAKSYLEGLNHSRSEDQKLIFFSYTSQHLGTPDNVEAFGRLLVVVPGNPEKWVQYGVPEFPRQAVRNVSIVAVEKRPNGTQNVYFRDHAVIRDSQGSLVLRGRFELGVGADGCVDCHKTGVNPIFQTPGSVSADELPMVDAVNQRFRTYLPPSFHGDYDPNWFGPGLGTFRPNASPDVLRERVRKALRNQGEVASVSQVASVARSVNCARCHEPSFLQPLNAPLNPNTLNSYVLGGKMPPGASLTFPERRALVDVIVDDYFSSEPPENGILMDWLLEERCEQ